MARKTLVRKKTASKPKAKPKARKAAKRVVKRTAGRVTKAKVPRRAQKTTKRRTKPKPARVPSKSKRGKRTNKRVFAVKRTFTQAVKRVVKRVKRTLATPKAHAKATPLSRILDAQRTKLRPRIKADPVVERFVRDLDQAIPFAEILLGGSYAKGTYLKGNYDIDIFVRFPIGTPDTVMSEHIARALPKASVMQGSRTYFQVKKGSFLFEIVPVCAITSPEQIRNVTDMSPLHVAYVRGALTPEQKDDVRLAKQFCKAAGVYGAESYIKGFSGYSLEILIAHYGGFEKLLLAAANTWPHAHGSKLVLDPAKYYRDSHSALLRLNEAKTQAPIILIDPVDKNRNAAAAVGVESYERFRAAAQAFLNVPSVVFFDTKLSIPRIRETWKGKKILFVTVKTPSDRQDIAGCKVLAYHEQAIRLLMETGFPLVHSEWRFGEKVSTCWYVLNTTTIPRTVEQRGPPAHMIDAVKAFREKHAQAIMRADESGKQRWFAPITRTYTQADKAIAAAWRGAKFTLKS